MTAAKSTRVEGERGGFLVKRGKPRYAYLQGKHYVVGNGDAVECASIREAYALRDKLLAERKEKRGGK